MTRSIRRFMPSPAMVVALVALFMALGGSAYALVITSSTIRNNSVRGVDIRNGALTFKDVKRDSLGSGAIKESRLGVVPAALVSAGLSRFAVVNGGGQLVRGRGVSSVARTGDGRYQAIFDGDVRGCAYFATIGDPSAAGPPQSDGVGVSSLASNVNGVAIRTESNANNTPQNRPFHLIVAC